MSAHTDNNSRLQTLIEAGLQGDSGPYLSLTIQRPQLAGNIQKWDILMKNAVQDIHQLLEDRFGDTADAPAEWSKRIGDSLSAIDPLEAQCGGWLIVAGSTQTDIFELQDTPQSHLVWDETPYLLPAITDGIRRIQGWVLAVGQQQADLFRWDGVTLHDESQRLDYRTYDEMRKTREPNANINLHTNSALRPNANGGAGGSDAQFHAAGNAADDYDEIQMRDYLNGVTKAVEPIISGTGNPLIVAGDPKTVGWTKDLFELHELQDKHIDLAGDSLNADILAERAAPIFTALNTADHELTDMGKGAPLTAFGLDDVDNAAQKGRIETLYLSEKINGFQNSDADERVTFDVLDGYTLPQRINRVVMRTIQAGGEVRVPPKALTLTDTHALARLRY